MGKSYSKTEDKEIMITQNAAGSNGAGISDKDIETHILTNNILISMVLVVFIAATVCLGCKMWRKKERKWMEKRMQTEFIKRIRQRLSGRFNATDAAGSEAV